jgi:hypothetical protein
MKWNTTDLAIYYLSNTPFNREFHKKNILKTYTFPVLIPLQMFPDLCNHSVPEGLAQHEFCTSQNNYFIYLYIYNIHMHL